MFAITNYENENNIEKISRILYKCINNKFKETATPTHQITITFGPQQQQHRQEEFVKSRRVIHITFMLYCIAISVH